MSEDQSDKVRAATDTVLALAAELEASGEVTSSAADLEAARAQLHHWVDSVVGVVSLPAFGRVTLIHADGGKSTVTSPDLSYVMSKPVTWARE